jgi:hypothetical protein
MVKLKFDRRLNFFRDTLLDLEERNYDEVISHFKFKIKAAHFVSKEYPR